MTIPRDFRYKGLYVAQHQNASEKFKLLFKKIVPSQILEIGTYNGGLTLLLRDILDDLNMESCKIQTYDIIDSPDILKNEILNGKNIDIKMKNIFDENFTKLIDNDIINYIQQEGPSIILCDNGNKIQEFNILSEYLKKGDIIMAHDYSPNIEYFNSHIKNKIWNYCEIKDDDILKSVEKYNLLPFMNEEFIEVVWVCKIKY